MCAFFHFAVSVALAVIVAVKTGGDSAALVSAVIAFFAGAHAIIAIALWVQGK